MDNMGNIRRLRGFSQIEKIKNAYPLLPGGQAPE
jgi:hypothetical protein